MDINSDILNSHIWVNEYEDNEVVIEKWNNNFELTLYITIDRIDYLKSWGPNIDNDMEDGTIENNNDLLDLFKWLDSK